MFAFPMIASFESRLRQINRFPWRHLMAQRKRIRMHSQGDPALHVQDRANFIAAQSNGKRISALRDKIRASFAQGRRAMLVLANGALS
jgi:hypothetical protein